MDLVCPQSSERLVDLHTCTTHPGGGEEREGGETERDRDREGREGGKEADRQTDRNRENSNSKRKLYFTRIVV